jgi:hypothetical protein
MSAAALPAGTEQLALVAALRQGTDGAGASRLGMSAVLLEHQSKVLPDEFRPRNSTFARRARQQSIVLRIQRDVAAALQQLHADDDGNAAVQ